METSTNYERCQAELRRLKINYQQVNHPAVETCEQADQYIKGYEGARTKTMLLTDKHHYYLLLMGEEARMDFKALRDKFGSRRLSLAKPAELASELGLHPGSVSPLGLLNSTDPDLRVYLDRQLLATPTWIVHPNDNTHTVFLKQEDLLRFITAQGYDYQVIDL